MKPGDKMICYSSVGAQQVTVVHVGLTVKTPLVAHATDRMVMVEYLNGGRGLAHEKQLERLALAEKELE